jgi:murein DD-endopeptidase MepM/ murein hydrolase activator NlpD
MSVPRSGGWVRAAFLLLLIQIAALASIYARLGLPSVVVWYVGRPALLLTVAVVLGFAFVGALRRQPHTPAHVAAYLALVIVVVSTVVASTYPSSWDARPSETRFRLPLDGPVTVAWGGPTLRVNYHAMLPDQRWAYDLLVMKDARTHRGDGTDLEDYYAYGMPVRAPTSGTVYAAHDGEPDESVGRRRVSRAMGNHIVLEVGPSEYLFVAHLQPGSVRVKPGERVSAGDVLGLVGNSGNSSEPHVHLHLQDTPRPYLAEGVPFFFYDYRVGTVERTRGMPRGGRSQQRYSGDIVEQVGEWIR